MIPDIGFSEILVIALVILLVTRPEDMPEIMRKLGIFMAHMRHFVAGMTGGLQGYIEPQPTPEAEPTPQPKQATKPRRRAPAKQKPKA